MQRILICLVLLGGTMAWGQGPVSPFERNGFDRPSNYDELSDYVKKLDEASPQLDVEIIGQSLENRHIYALKYSSSEFGKDPNKLRVIVFAQQHGNEQSGKEGALLLAGELIKPENQYLLKHIDLAIIPQVNPDGSEQNKRRNSKGVDLNRNHLVLEQPEVVALHRFFDKYLFHANMDVHEYAPYGETWKAYGYRNNSDVLIGCGSNINIAKEIRDLSSNGFIPFYLNYLTERKFSTSLYAPGGPPEIEYIRLSTFDINDGRQSFGIQNSFSFIQEGLNGIDNFSDNIKHRADGQKTGIRALLEYCHANHAQIKTLVETERAVLLDGKPARVAIQMEHVANGQRHALHVYSYATGNDSTIMVRDYRPAVRSVTDVSKPQGYLVPKSCRELIDWAARYNLTTSKLKKSPKFKIEQYAVGSLDSIDFEGDVIVDPNVVATDVTQATQTRDYIYIPTGQIKGNLIVTALEPKSELGLVTYPSYSHLLKADSPFPVLRVVKK
ncbi:MAG: M14 family zinc carboxypeptidase [Breznakibacter sp.]